MKTLLTLILALTTTLGFSSDWVSFTDSMKGKMDNQLLDLFQQQFEHIFANQPPVLTIKKNDECLYAKPRSKKREWGSLVACNSTRYSQEHIIKNLTIEKNFYLQTGNQNLSQFGFTYEAGLFKNKVLKATGIKTSKCSQAEKIYFDFANFSSDRTFDIPHLKSLVIVNPSLRKSSYLVYAEPSFGDPFYKPGFIDIKVELNLDSVKIQEMFDGFSEIIAEPSNNLCK